ncbi:MAG TPA: OmpA family protein [Bacteroidales bacterium]|nr:OmpA family protein [Bacteroidales bacterium]HPT01696.1 OmpA family protein [Bacteroidales bacterium]
MYRKSLMIMTGMILLAGFTSCVSTKKYNSLATRCKDENTKLTAQVDELTTEVNELTAQGRKLKNENTELKSDTARLGSAYRVLQGDYSDLDQSFSMLKAQNEGNLEETERIMADLKNAQDNLIVREDNLKQLQAELDAKSLSLRELQSALNRNDSITKAMRKAVADALLGFEGKGLTVYTKNGKVYVSMDEKLLFASGKWDVSPDGVAALKNLAGVLEDNPDISVMIEGHTDNVPYNGTGQVKDNWDLSVMRATAIVKILTANSNIEPKRLIASGRSEYLPVEPNTSAASKAKNRRTEIILTPKLDELLQIIGNN